MTDGRPGARGPRGTRRGGLLRGLKWVAVAVVLILAAFLALGLSPRAKPLDDQSEVVVGGDPRVNGSAIRPHTARYSTWSRVLGVPVERSQVEVTVIESTDGLTVGFDFASGLKDEMVLDRRTLEPIRRGFPGQRFSFMGSTVEATLGREGDEPSVRTFEFPGRVFEVSVLDLIVAAADASPPMRVAFDNFGDPDGWFAAVRTVGEETIEGPGGRAFDTRIVDLGFTDGRVRRYWLSDRPPYKIRQRTFERGRSIVSGWDLEELIER